MKHQVYNPFLPLWETVPDGEPHVFEGRLYLYGSHDQEGGDRYCQQGNYVGWSAPVDDLSDWRYEGVIFEAKQDPRVQGALCDPYAPDVVRGNDGRYYLYYCISGGASETVADTHNTPIGVAVCNTPAGKYEYYGFVRNPDGSIAQVPCSSCGLNGGPLKAEGEYPAVIACNLTNSHMPHLANRHGDSGIPYITHSGEGEAAERYITNIKDGTRIVFKSFALRGPVSLRIQTRAAGSGSFTVKLDDTAQGTVSIPATETWTEYGLRLAAEGDHALELCYRGGGAAELRSIGFLPGERKGGSCK